MTEQEESTWDNVHIEILEIDGSMKSSLLPGLTEPS